MILDYARLFRVVWLSGRYGGGKTALAVKIAQELSAEYQFVASNLSLVGECVVEFSSFDEVASQVENCVVIYDEAWQELGQGASPREVRRYLAYLRKRDQVLLLPSVLPLARGARVVRVWREFNGLVFGVPVWVYRYVVEGLDTVKKAPRWWWWFPQSVWRYYNHAEIPGSVWRVYRLPLGFASEAQPYSCDVGSVGSGVSGFMAGGFVEAFCSDGSSSVHSDA